MVHINQIRFEGKNSWEEAMNIANDYWTRFCDENLTQKERDNAFECWMQIRYELETGKYN
jgi:hypothetical protein